MKLTSLQLHSARCTHAKYLLAASGLAFLLSGCGGDSSGWVSLNNPVEPDVPTVIEANIDTLAAQIGGGTQVVEYMVMAFLFVYTSPSNKL